MSRGTRSEGNTTPIASTAPEARQTHLRGAANSSKASSSNLGRHKTASVDDFKTLKQACPSEYQGAQCAFKDSMIH